MEKLYNHKEIESKIQKHWKENNFFQVKENYNQKKYYCLSMFPYPSGKLHMGHVRNYTIGDVIARYQRMLGKNVLHPIGWDAFGLPAEEAAIQNNIFPSKWTYENIKYMKKQLKSLGYSYDWTREIITCKPEFYRWEQWFFIKLYKKKLVYRKKSIVNWCPNEHVVLANEQVINGTCWRCSTNVIKKNISQWFIRITKYADKLLSDLKDLKDWPIEVKNMQKNWIGKSTGIEFKLNVFKSNEKISVFTTRPDCVMGATFVAISPFHKFAKILSKKNTSIKTFIQSSISNFSSIKNIEKFQNEGLNTCKFAIHPITKTLLPIWIANFVLSNHGSGAIISVPAHNLNDWKFANINKIKIKPVILYLNGKKPQIDNLPMMEKGNLFNSGILLNGLNNRKAINVIKKLLEKNNDLKNKNYYKLKDWNISRQRYWGAPIPIIQTKDKQLVIPKEQLPLTLPENVSLNKLYNSNNKQIYQKYTINIHGKKTLCEIDTFDTFVESSWYYLRYTNPNYSNGMIDPKAEKYWLPVDYYIGGIEHAVMHLLYFRFFHKLLKDFNLVTTKEPVKKLLCQGMVLSSAYYILKNNKKIWIEPSNIHASFNKEKKKTYYYDKESGEKVIYAGMIKMSKSKKNGIEPSTIIKKYGADSLRLFIIVAAPIESSLEWNENGVKGTYRFLQKLWKTTYEFLNNKKINSNVKLNSFNNKQNEIRYNLNKTIITVSNSIEKRQSFNTAISTIFKFFNTLKTLNLKSPQEYFIMKESLFAISKMLHPFTPHFSDTLLFHLRGNKKRLHNEKWPKPDLKLIQQHAITILIQINGKTRQIIHIKNTLKKNEIISIARNNTKISSYLNKLHIKKIIYIPTKVVNFVL